MHYLKKYSTLIIVLLLSFFTIQPLFAAGFFAIHDDTQVARVYEMKTALADGMFPVRWVPDLGYNYGYPIFNFYGPLAYYVGGFFNLIGFDSLVSTKIMIILGTLLAGVFMYLLAKEFWGKIGGIISALLYMYAPYHALNIYVRGAIGELWAYGLLPFAFFGMYKVFTSLNDNTSFVSSKSKVKSQNFVWIWVSVSALSYAAIVTSHNLTAMMVTPFLFFLGIFLYIVSRFQIGPKESYFILVGLLLGIFLSAFYWLPVLFEMKYTNVLSVVGGGSDYKDHFVCIKQLWDSQWGFGGSTPGCVDGMSFKVGKLHLLLGILSLAPLFFMRSRKSTVFAIGLSFLGAFATLFLTLDVSKFIWDAIPHMAFFQFPWRFLVLASFFLSFLGGAIFLHWKPFMEKRTIVLTLAAIFSVAIIVHNAKLFVPDKMNNKTAADYTRKEILVWNTSLISDEYMPPGFQRPRSLAEVPEKKILETKDAKIISYNEKTQIIRAEVVMQKKAEIPVYIAYFPGWHVYIDNKQEEFRYYKNGLLVSVPQGKHVVEVKFSQTPIEVIGNILSLAGVFILLAGIIFSRKAHKK